MVSPKERLLKVEERMESAARRAGRDAKGIALVAVTKTVPLDRILPFLQAGIQHVGENRVQEALTKSSELRGQNAEIKLHLIGPLQSNKAKKAVENFDVIQTLDRWEIAQDLERHAGALGKTQDCLVQVKISDELSKSGLDPMALPEFIDKVIALPHLRIRGLMGIPPLTAVGDKARPYFSTLRTLFERSRLEILSMGMSSNFEAAIEEGSTMVRIGRALFGPRE